MEDDLCGRGMALCEGLSCNVNSSYTCKCDPFFYTDGGGACNNNFAFKFWWYWYFVILFTIVTYGFILTLNVGVLLKLLLYLRRQVLIASLRNVIVTLVFLTCIFRIAFAIFDPYGVWFGHYWGLTTFISQCLNGLGTAFFLMTFISVVTFWARMCHKWFNKLATRLFGKLLPFFLGISGFLIIIEFIRSAIQVWIARAIADYFNLYDRYHRLEKYVPILYYIYMFWVMANISFFMVLYGMRILTEFRKKRNVLELLDEDGDTVKEDATVVEDEDSDVDDIVIPKYQRRRGVKARSVYLLMKLRPKLFHSRNAAEAQTRKVTILIVSSGTIFAFLSIFYLMRIVVDLLSLLVEDLLPFCYFAHIFLDFVSRTAETAAIMILMYFMFTGTYLFSQQRSSTSKGRADTEVETFEEMVESVASMDDVAKEEGGGDSVIQDSVENSDYEVSDEEELDATMRMMKSMERDLKASISDFREFIEAEDATEKSFSTSKDSIAQDLVELQNESSVNVQVNLKDTVVSMNSEAAAHLERYAEDASEDRSNATEDEGDGTELGTPVSSSSRRSSRKSERGSEGTRGSRIRKHRLGAIEEEEKGDDSEKRLDASYLDLLEMERLWSQQNLVDDMEDNDEEDDYDDDYYDEAESDIIESEVESVQLSDTGGAGLAVAAETVANLGEGRYNEREKGIVHQREEDTAGRRLQAREDAEGRLGEWLKQDTADTRSGHTHGADTPDAEIVEIGESSDEETEKDEIGRGRESTEHSDDGVDLGEFDEEAAAELERLGTKLITSSDLRDAFEAFERGEDDDWEQNSDVRSLASSQLSEALSDPLSEVLSEEITISEEAEFTVVGKEHSEPSSDEEDVDMSEISSGSEVEEFSFDM